MTGSASPVRGAVEVLEAGVQADGGWHSKARFGVREIEPVFAGHYPGLPLFPGVCLVECVHRGAVAARPPGTGELRLAELGSARFVSAVVPGDVLDLALDWKREDGGWRVSAKIGTARGRAATVRLHYAEDPA